jgi:glycolate oxidase FAD binding subunit
MIPHMTQTTPQFSALAEQIRDAAARRQPLAIRGGNSKAWYGRAVEGETLDMRPWLGVLAYDPTELVITACAGTPLRDIEALLAEHGQMLAFEPPHFSEHSTVGGTIAAGLAGRAVRMPDRCAISYSVPALSTGRGNYWNSAGK